MRRSGAKGDWLRRTGCVFRKGRGIFGHDDSRMESLGFENGFKFSQEKPLPFSPSESSSGVSQGWSHQRITALLEACRMHRFTRNSSIRFFFILACVGVANSMAQTRSASRPDPVRSTANQFEAMMLSQIYQELENSSLSQNSGEGVFAVSPTEKIYRSWLNHEVMTRMADHRPLKIGDLVEDQLRGNVGIRKRGLIKSNLRPQGKSTGSE